MANKTTLADYLAELGVDVNNMQEFLNKLSQMLTSASDTVTISQTLQDGTSKDFVVPSFAYLKNKILAIDDKFNSLLTGNANRIAVKDENGNIRNFELTDVASVITDLETVNTKTVPTPTTFQYKTNWFFESFLNPLIYVNIPVDNLMTEDIDKFEVTRLIVSSADTIQSDYFDSTYKGKNGIAYTDLINDLNARGILFFEDINETDLPPAQNNRSGSFDVLSILSDTQAEVVTGTALTTTVTKYILNTLRYYEKSDSSKNGVIQKTLKAGDLLITPDNSEYKIKAVDTTQRSISVERIFGIGDLTVGANKLIIKPQLVQVKNLSINLGYNERQVIFLKPISTRLKITTQRHSQGFGIFTNELNITLSSGQTVALSDFYTKFVSDFGLMFLNYAKEKRLPASVGAVPNSVVLASSNFKVVQSDAHIKEADTTKDVNQNISSIETIKSQIKEIDRQISEKRAELNTNAALTAAQQLKLNKDLSSLSDQRKASSSEYSSKISSVTTAVKNSTGIIKDPTYRVRGFWAIPDPVSTEHGLQQVVQFRVAYRVLSKTGTAEKAEQFTITDPKGNKITGAFSPWKEIVTKARSKKFNDATGFYEWQAEDIANPEQVNSNQIDLPINKGQVLEIKVKSLSEAGWPESAVESDWSNSITVEFPAEIQTLEDVTIISQQAFAEEVKIGFQDELNAKGLDIHLGTSFTSRDKYFAHRSEDIASGFFSADGSIIDLYTKLKSITDTLAAIQTSLASGTGELKVSIIDQLGNEVTVTKGQTVSIFAGYYKDQIKSTTRFIPVFRNGEIITNQYVLRLENTSQTPLQLISTLTGGIGERATTSDPIAKPSDSYHTSLRYDVVPLNIQSNAPGSVGGLVQKDGLQSAQVKGQVVYFRANAVDLSTDLIDGDRSVQRTSGSNDPNNISYAANSSYTYQGTLIGNTTVPYTDGHYLPYDPTLGGLTVKYQGSDKTLNANTGVWKGTLDSNSAPVGGGLLSEFCISIDHPDIKPGGKYNGNWNDIKKPMYTSTNQTSQLTLPFSHAPHFEIAYSETANEFGVKWFEQAAYRKPEIPNPIVQNTQMIERNYPIKLGFSPNDKYLIGKYTCGAYLYASPNSLASIAATSFTPTLTTRSVQNGTANAINIPIVFQYRCSDYKGYVGGYRVGSQTGLKNVKYSKKMGIDIYTKDSTFSFDLEITAQYEKETSVITPITPIAQSNTLTSGLTYSHQPPTGAWWQNFTRNNTAGLI